MRDISVDIISRNIKEMCIEANHMLSPDMKVALVNDGPVTLLLDSEKLF